MKPNLIRSFINYFKGFTFLLYVAIKQKAINYNNGCVCLKGLKCSGSFINDYKPVCKYHFTDC